MNSKAARGILIGRPTVLGAGLLIGLAFGLAGCSGSSSNPAQASGVNASSAAAAAAGGTNLPAVQGTDVPPTSGAGLPSGESAKSAVGSKVKAGSLSSATKSAKVTPQLICTVIQGMQPSLDAATAPDAARLTLQLQISDYFDQVHANPRLTGAGIDKAMEKSCPAVRKAALKPTGKKAFADIL